MSYGPTQRELRAIVVAAKSMPCVDCVSEGLPGTWPLEAMQFDHIPERGVKIANVAHFVNARDHDGLLAEIAKCEVVCSNHHAIRSRARGKSVATKARMAIANRMTQSDPMIRARLSRLTKAQWSDPEHRAKKVLAMSGAKAKRRA